MFDMLYPSGPPDRISGRTDTTPMPRLKCYGVFNYRGSFVKPLLCVSCLSMSFPGCRVLYPLWVGQVGLRDAPTVGSKSYLVFWRLAFFLFTTSLNGIRMFAAKSPDRHPGRIQADDNPFLSLTLHLTVCCIVPNMAEHLPRGCCRSRLAAIAPRWVVST